MDATLIALGVGALGLLYAAFLIRGVLAQPEGSEEMRRISLAIREGAMAFLAREYRTLGVFVLVVAAGLSYFLGWQTSLAYVFGTLCSAGTGWVGMQVAVRANVRTTEAARTGLNAALRVAFNSGAVMGLSVVSVGLIGVSLVILLTGANPGVVAGFGFGASSIALFARVGGGIYTKAADVGADLVGKTEAGIPEDDPRNPAVIADNVGDNVGDVAGMGADLFESYVGSIVAALALAVVTAENTTQLSLPLLVAAGGIVASIIGSMFVRVGERPEMGVLLNALRRGIYLAGALAVAASLAAVLSLGLSLNFFWAIVVGLVAGLLVAIATEFYTSYTYAPTQALARSADTGPATVIISGFALGMQSTIVPVVVLGAAVLVAYALGGLYGIALAGVGLLSTLGITLATDAYGPVADNAGGIAEMAHLPAQVRERTDALDSLGNTTAATGKGFAIGSAVLTALALMAAYTQAANVGTISVLDPRVLVGILAGAMLPFAFSALTMQAVAGAAYAMVTEVRRQFREIPGLLEGKAQPEYARCVDISTGRALREMVLPGTMAVAAPLGVGLTLGPEALGGLLVGATASGFLLAVTMANAGGAWDNAKKVIEAGNRGGKGSAAHHAAVVGDTVGDPFKDTSGPSLNILIKLMSVVSLVCAPLLGG
ncbi:MAG: sodium-translocating pyrophosphatase [Chloroflexi bacterium]|nr:sodium-translocating pyrophosphatase [Chloroflexota bacterium]